MHPPPFGGYTRQESGYNANRHEYSTWGNNTKAPSYNYDPEYRATEPYYTGHPYDGSLNLYFAENRFYDPETGSWLSPDPVKDGLNWYQYCGSNPVSRVEPLGLVPYAAAQQNRPEPPQEHYAPGENLREGGFYDRLGCEEKKVIWQYQQAFTSHNAGLAYEFFYFGYISGMPDPVMADQIGVLMAKLFSGGYEINEREFIRGREDMSNALMLVGLGMLMNGAAGAAKGNASGGNMQFAMAGGGTMDAAMAITAENAMVIAAMNSMYPDTSNDGIIRRIEGESDPVKPEAAVTGSKKHGVNWKEGPARAKATGNPQGQWAKSDLDYATEMANTLKPGESAYFDLPEGSQSIVHLPDGSTQSATRMWIRNNGTGTWHGYPMQ